MRPSRAILFLAVAIVLGGSLAGCGAVPRALSLPARSLPNLTADVDPFIGTLGDGNVFPGAVLPHGMVQWSPDTSAGGLTRPGGYNHGDLIIRGFSLTHLSGAGCVAFGDVPVMPTLRPVTVPPLPNGSPYSVHFVRPSERASPGYYGVRLAGGIQVQLTVTARSGMGRFTFPASRTAHLLINVGGSVRPGSNLAGASGASVQVVGDREITGSASGGHFCGLPNAYTVYFSAVFSRPFSGAGTWQGRQVRPGRVRAAGPRSGAFLTFDTRPSRTVLMKIGLSYVSARQALLNLAREDPGWNFAAVRRRAQVTWNELLSRVQATGGTPAQERTFYTALYHALLQPSVFSDVDGRYVGFDRRVHRARGYVQYANFSGWDIYRSVVPLLAWLMPRQTSDMMQSLVADARQGGWLPKWPVANDYTGEMDGDSADPILADAYAFGARHFDKPAAVRFMLKGATQPGRGPKGYIERPGLESYLRAGYVRPQAGSWGSAAETLEYAVDDFSLARLAGSLRMTGTERAFMRRAESWRSLFNPATGFLEPRTARGSFPTWFDPRSTSGFVEGNAWQYRWMVPQNLAGLFRAMGGNARAAAGLDSFFTRLDAGPGAPFYWAGNEPSLEAPWEYDAAGRPWRTQAVVRRIINRLYSTSPAGLPGNDDLGTMSAWYVWAALGLYPEIPGVGGFALGSPLFPSITVFWGDGKVLHLEAPGASASRPYVTSLQLDGRAIGRTWLPLGAITSAATLRFGLSDRPDRLWGAAPSDHLPSY